jgi:hypothetical protein
MSAVLFIYEFDTEDMVVISTKAKILKEGFFSYITSKGKISKFDIGKIRYIDKGNHTNSVFVIDRAIDDALELFTRSLYQNRKNRMI